MPDQAGWYATARLFRTVSSIDRVIGCLSRDTDWLRLTLDSLTSRVFFLPIFSLSKIFTQASGLKSSKMIVKSQPKRQGRQDLTKDKTLC